MLDAILSLPASVTSFRLGIEGIDRNGQAFFRVSNAITTLSTVEVSVERPLVLVTVGTSVTIDAKISNRDTVQNTYTVTINDNVGWYTGPPTQTVIVAPNSVLVYF